MKTNNKYKMSLIPGRAADSGFELGSARLPSCFRAVCACPETDANLGNLESSIMCKETSVVGIGPTRLDFGKCVYEG